MSQDFTNADLGALNITRQQALFLHNQSVLTRGPAALLRRSVLARLCGLTGVHSVASRAEGLMLQAQHFPGRSLAALIFLAPRAAATADTFTPIMEFMLTRLGPHGVQGIAAELDEHSAASVALQKAGLTAQCHQRIWKVTTTPPAGHDHLLWQPYLSRHALAVRLLRSAVVPSQMQHLEFGASDNRDAFVLYEGGQLNAFADVQRGPKGIWVQVLADPGAPMADALMALLILLRPRTNRPVYLSVRAYQDWQEPLLEGLDAQPGPRQVVLVRRMVQPVKVKDVQKIARAAGIEASTIQYPVKQTAPMDE